MSGWTILASSDTPSGGLYDFSGLSLGSVKMLRIFGCGMEPNLSQTGMILQFRVGGSLLTGASDYDWGVPNALSTSGSVNNDGDNLHDGIRLGSNDTDWMIGLSGTPNIRSGGFEVYVDRPASTAVYKRVVGRAWMVGPTGNGHVHPIHGKLRNTGAIDGIRVTANNQFAAGKIRIYTLS